MSLVCTLQPFTFICCFCLFYAFGNVFVTHQDHAARPRMKSNQGSRQRSLFVAEESAGPSSEGHSAAEVETYLSVVCEIDICIAR